MILRASAAPAALYLALAGPSAVGAAEPLLRGRVNQPDHRSLGRGGFGVGRPGRGGGKLRDRFKKLGPSGCTVLEKVGLCKGEGGIAERCHDGPMKRMFACEDLETGDIYDVDNDVEEIAKGGTSNLMDAFAFDDYDAKANLLTSAKDDFIGDANLDLKTGRISFVKGKFGKSRNQRGRGKGWKWQDLQGRRLEQVGNRNVIALNVISSDATNNNTGYSNEHLANRLFGSLVGGDDQVNLASQFSACSYDQLNFVPQPDKTSSSPTTVSHIIDGVATVYSSMSNSDRDSAMRNDATSKLGVAHGYRGGANSYVMVCLPNAALSGVAYAYINHWLSVYSHTWCTVPSAQMHEVGHNLGLSHAGEGTNEYADTTGFMGYASNTNEQRRCFTGPKTYKLGWFSDRHVELEAGVDSFNGRLYGFTQYAATTPNDKMIIRMNDRSCSTCDWYISFNHDFGFNENTGEGQNRVQLHTKEGSPSQYKDTYIRAKLAAGQSYTAIVNGNNVEVSVGAINTAEGWAEVSVGGFTNAPTTSSAPSMAPAAGSYYLGCGSTAGSCREQTREAEVNELHELRCCSTSSLSGWNQYTSGCWGLSEIGSDGCIHGINFNEGRKKCLDAGGDLCTLDQLQSDCSRGSGCSHDSDFIWSLDKVPDATPLPTTPPTSPPTSPPTNPLTNSPTNTPTNSPTNTPTNTPTNPPTNTPPTNTPTNTPTNPLTNSPTNVATNPPTNPPTIPPTNTPTNPPTNTPTNPPTNTPTNTPTNLPTNTPTNLPTNPPTTTQPTNTPTKQPTNPPTSEDTHFNVVCGSTAGSCRNKPVQEAERTELHEVRCCSDTNHGGGWMQKPNCNVWGESEVLGVCRKGQTYDQAVAHCASMDARLCTEDELLGDCTRGSGCSHDDELNWSSTAVVPATMAPTGTPLEGYAWLACGNSESPECMTPTAIAAVEETHEVRCCSETKLDNGWEKKPGCTVWGESEIDGECRVETHQRAAGLCAGVGARLCTKDEMTSDCTAGTGCQFDSEMAWTSTPVPPCTDDASCDDGNSCTINTCGITGICENTPVPGCARDIVGGASTGDWFGTRVQKVDASELHEVRCCSDTSRPGWVKNGGCGVWGESDLPTCNSEKTFTEAHDICAEQNARLCTTDEILSDCTRGSGCQFDHEHVWTSTAAYPVCATDSDCEDGDSCTTNTCGANGVCTALPIPSCTKAVVGGSSAGGWGGLRTREASPSDLHAVRCCSDSLKSGWVHKCKNAGGFRRNVWGGSNINGQCHRRKTFAQAVGICSGVGGRICTSDEVLSDCTRGSGCQYDDEHIWTTTPYIDQAAAQPITTAAPIYGGIDTSTTGTGATPATTTHSALGDNIVTTESPPVTSTSFPDGNYEYPGTDGNMEEPDRF